MPAHLPPHGGVPAITTAKAQWRRQILAARAAIGREAKLRRDARLAEHAARLPAAGSTVCAYLPIGTEPGSLAMLESMLAAGTALWLPIARSGPSGETLPLSWARFTGKESLVPAPFGLWEPGGEQLPPEFLATVDLILVPALAVDDRGTRLGRGGGFYDRSLPFAGPHTRLLGVVNDEERVPELPGEAHDIRLAETLTPTAGVGRLNPLAET